METTKEKGDITELVIAGRLAIKGYRILFPYGDRSRYDLVIEKDDVFKKVQCKTGRYRKGCVVFNTCSATTKDGENISEHYIGQVDFFGIYSPELGTAYFVPASECNNKHLCQLRIDKPMNGQVERIKWAKDFEI